MIGGITTQDGYLLVKDILTGGFTLAGLVIAGRGLAAWKKQTKGVKEIDAVYNLNFSILKLRDAIKHVRNPAIWPSETQRAVKFLKEKYSEKPEKEVDANIAVYEMRWQKITDAYTEAESHLLAAEVLWGPEILNLMKPLDKKVTELNINLKQLFDPEMRTKNPADIRNVVYNQSNGDCEDDFAKDISKAIKTIADYLKDKIK